MSAGLQLNSSASGIEANHTRISTSPIARPNLDFKPKLWPQLLAAFAANMGAFAFGTVISWSATGFPSLEEDTNFASFSQEDLSWMSSSATLGACISCIPSGIFVDRFGRRKAMIFLTLPFLAGWILMYFSQNVWMMIGGRFLTGFGGGGYSLAAPVYVAETSESKYRGMFISGFDVLTGIGMLYILICGTYLHWKNQVLVCVFVPFITCLMIFLVPESPRYLLSKGFQTEGIKSLCWLRGTADSQQIKAELFELMQNVEENRAEPLQVRIRELKNPAVRRAAILGFLLFVFQVLTGITAVLFYTVYIFKSAGADVDEYTSAIIIGSVGIIPGILASLAVDRYGRRVLLLISEALMVLAHASLGAYFNVKESKPDVAEGQLGWLPLVALVVFMIGYSMGLGPITYIVVPEILPQRVRGLVSSITTSLRWGLAFLVTRFFYNLLTALGDDGGYWFFGGICLLGFFYIFFFIPETKGKSLEEIQLLFARE